MGQRGDETGPGEGGEVGQKDEKGWTEADEWSAAEEGDGQGHEGSRRLKRTGRRGKRHTQFSFNLMIGTYCKITR